MSVISLPVSCLFLGLLRGQEMSRYRNFYCLPYIFLLFLHLLLVPLVEITVVFLDSFLHSCSGCCFYQQLLAFSCRQVRGREWGWEEFLSLGSRAKVRQRVNNNTSSWSLTIFHRKQQKLNCWSFGVPKISPVLPTVTICPYLQPDQNSTRPTVGRLSLIV